MIKTTLLAILIFTNNPNGTRNGLPRMIDIEIAKEISPKNRRMLRKINKGNQRHFRKLMRKKGASAITLQEVSHV